MKKIFITIALLIGVSIIIVSGVSKSSNQLLSRLNNENLEYLGVLSTVEGVEVLKNNKGFLRLGKVLSGKVENESIVIKNINRSLINERLMLAEETENFLKTLKTDVNYEDIQRNLEKLRNYRRVKEEFLKFNVTFLYDEVTPIKYNIGESKESVEFVSPLSGRYKLSKLMGISKSSIGEGYEFSFGVGFKPEEGSECSVNAIQSGVVIDIFKNVNNTYTVDLVHLDGIVSRYSGLSEIENLKVSSEIKINAPIGKIKEKESLIFEILVNGLNVDPLLIFDYKESMALLNGYLEESKNIVADLKKKEENIPEEDKYMTFYPEHSVPNKNKTLEYDPKEKLETLKIKEYNEKYWPGQVDKEKERELK